MAQYNKEVIEREAEKSLALGRMTDKIGKFTLMISREVSLMFATGGMEAALIQELEDSAVMAVCEKFFRYYNPNRKQSVSAANLIISIVHDTMKRRLQETKWKDLYGQLNKEFVPYVDDDGRKKFKLTQSKRDETISRVLSGEHINELL